MSKEKEKTESTETTKKLGVKDRLQIIAVLLPKQGDILTLTIAKDIQEKIEFTQKEIELIGLKPKEGGGFEWKEKGFEKEIIFTKAEMELLRNQINELDKQKKINAEMLSLCILLRD